MSNLCFSCKNKMVIPVSKEKQREIRTKRMDLKLSHFRTPEIVSYCIIHMKSIESTDSACQYFQESKLHSEALDTLGEVLKDMRRDLE